MPCISSHMEPTAVEKHIQKTAKLFVYLYTRLNLEVPKAVADAANNIYASDRDIEPALCKAMQTLKHTNEGMFNNIVYDGRVPESRDLAAWWQAHEQFDQARQKRELTVFEVALSKLSREEADALGWAGLWDTMPKEK